MLSNRQAVMPCLAECGMAWWLLCQPSPSQDTEQRIIAAVVGRLKGSTADRVPCGVDGPGHVLKKTDAGKAGNQHRPAGGKQVCGDEPVNDAGTEYRQRDPPDVVIIDKADCRAPGSRAVSLTSVATTR